MEDVRITMTREEMIEIQDNMSRKKIQTTIDMVKELFLWGRIVDSPSVARLNEEAWIDFAERNNYIW